MKQWEKIKLALNSPEEWLRARYMFELMEEERKDGVASFKSFSMGSEIKLALHTFLRRVKDKLEEKGNYPAKSAIDACVEEVEQEEKERKSKEIAALESIELKELKTKAKKSTTK